MGRWPTSLPGESGYSPTGPLTTLSTGVSRRCDRAWALSIVVTLGKRWLFLYGICQWCSVNILVSDKPARQIRLSVQTAVVYCIANNDNYYHYYYYYYQYSILQTRKPNPRVTVLSPKVPTLARFPNSSIMPLYHSLWFGDFWVGIL